MTAALLRCAIYTRKSSEEGLEQDFNSLHAQREACEAYIRSQVSEGWRALPALYDDGGFSGGSLERPGLKRLLDDVAAGRIDIVVVYKVDRLTRALTDFAKIVETFDARGVSFVSVTQAFNTTTSMGRLTLNVLLSFAQFEREVTGERIRDKIAASKAKGMWMGGVVPLGYDISGRSLAINPAEADTVRYIFRRYLELRSVKELAADLASEGIVSKRRTTIAGGSVGGVVLTRGALFHILRSRIYRGEIVHRDKVFAGRHEAIVAPELFADVAAKLSDQAVARAKRSTRAAPAALKGRIFDSAGRPLSPSFGYGSKGKLYRYYIAMDLQKGAPTPLASDGIRRVSAPAIEGFLTSELRRLGVPEVADPLSAVQRVELHSSETQIVLSSSALFGSAHPELALNDLRSKLAAGEQAVFEDKKRKAVRIVLARRLVLRGGRTWITGSTKPGRARISKGLVDALRRAHTNLVALNASPFSPPAKLKDAVSPPTQHERLVSRLAFLAPGIQAAIMSGQQPEELQLRDLLKNEMPLAWTDQIDWLAEVAGTAGPRAREWARTSKSGGSE